MLITNIKANEKFRNYTCLLVRFGLRSSPSAVFYNGRVMTIIVTAFVVASQRNSPTPLRKYDERIN